MNIDKKIISFLYEAVELESREITGVDIIHEFSNYSRGYVFDRTQVLKSNRYISSTQRRSRFLKLTDKGKKWAIEIEEEKERKNNGTKSVSS